MRRLLDGDRFPASEQRLHLALDAAQMGIFEWDIERDHFAWMHLHAGLFGVPSAQFGQNYLAFEQRMHPHDRAETSASIQIAIKTRENFRHEYRVLWSDGSEHWQEIRARLSPGNQSQPARLTGVVFNITDAKTAEQSIKQRQAQLAQLTRVATMGQMASGLAHELTQPLGAILNYAGACMVQMPNRSDIPAEIIKSIGEVITETRRAGAICSRMRLFVRNHLPRCAPVQMNTVVNESLKMMDWELRTRMIQIKLELSDPLPMVFGDAVQIQQVLVNLILNAADAMAEQSPATLRISTAVTRDAKKVEVCVTDSGTGMSPAHFLRLFDPFFTTKPNGLGMGLNISRSLVEDMGGSLTASAIGDRGMRFCFTIPIQADGAMKVIACSC